MLNLTSQKLDEFLKIRFSDGKYGDDIQKQSRIVKGSVADSCELVPIVLSLLSKILPVENLTLTALAMGISIGILLKEDELCLNGK
jgi:hypothetical protein